MACTCGYDSTCGCDCCGKPESGAGRPEADELRAGSHAWRPSSRPQARQQEACTVTAQHFWRAAAVPKMAAGDRTGTRRVPVAGGEVR